MCFRAYLELEDDPRQEDYEQQLRCRELMSLLDRAEATATGITAKGIRALRMMCDGYLLMCDKEVIEV